MRVLIILFLTLSVAFSGGFSSNYYKLSIKEQKREFANIMSKMLKKSNDSVMKEREFVKKFFSSFMFARLNEDRSSDFVKLVKLAKKYKIKLIFDKQTYLKRIDVVPVSLGIAQAALESAWGKSRFAQEANNIYGHWTFSGKGLTPNDRDEDKTHQIKIFNSLQDATNAYVLNLNRHKAYRIFRDKREQFRMNERDFTGLDAAKTMVNYSEIKEKYVHLVSNLIVQNDFLVYD